MHTARGYSRGKEGAFRKGQGGWVEAYLMAASRALAPSGSVSECVGGSGCKGCREKGRVGSGAKQQGWGAGVGGQPRPAYLGTLQCACCCRQPGSAGAVCPGAVRAGALRPQASHRTTSPPGSWTTWPPGRRQGLPAPTLLLHRPQRAPECWLVLHLH